MPPRLTRDRYRLRAPKSLKSVGERSISAGQPRSPESEGLVRTDLHSNAGPSMCRNGRSTVLLKSFWAVEVSV